jgi:hypothetical protein
MHLGLRYTLLLVDANTNTPTDSTRVFKQGECVAIELESNRSGYLYVMNRQSDGNWAPLIPSSQAPEETNTLDPGKRIRVPKEHCFQIDDPPGTETMVVVFSRDPRDFMQLYEGMKGSTPAEAAPNPRRKAADQTLVADAGKVNSAVDQITKQFGTRNLSIRRLDQPKTPQERPHSVYIVNVSDRPSSTLVARIEIRHR